jgi:hypothetical protein
MAISFAEVIVWSETASHVRSLRRVLGISSGKWRRANASLLLRIRLGTIVELVSEIEALGRRGALLRLGRELRLWKMGMLMGQGGMGVEITCRNQGFPFSRWGSIRRMGDVLFWGSACLW